MAKKLAVRDVREALYRAGSSTGDGQPSVQIVGQLFHEVFADIISSSRGFIRRVLQDAEPGLQSWQETLKAAAYQTLVGPRLKSHQAALHGHAEATLNLWGAVCGLCDWLGSTLWESRPKTAENLDEYLQSLLLDTATEVPLVWEIQQAGWRESVQVTGIADAVLRTPSKSWCLVEVKLGATSPEADLGQACLYHSMLAQGMESGLTPAGELAVLSFRPDLHEVLYTTEKLANAQSRLLELIGHLAGVLPTDKLKVVKAGPIQPQSVHRELGERMVRAFREYGAEVTIADDPIVGPTFIRYPLRLGKGVRAKKVETTAEELSHRLNLEASPVVGKPNGQLVVDVQRPDRQVVTFDSVRGQLPPLDRLHGSSSLLLGVDLDGQLQWADLAEPGNAHALVAGSTGSGKSEWLRVAIAGLLLTNTPETLRLVLIDPKRNAFGELQDSPFLYDEQSLVFPDERPASEVLEGLVEEMNRRYAMFEGDDSLHAYVARTGQPIPQVIVVCDEYYDLIIADSQERKAIERQIGRLGAKARAAGIHLVLATQRPSRETVSGAIKANMSVKIGFRTSDVIESRLTINHAGCERLLGRGDMLFFNVGAPQRLQSPYLPPADRIEIFQSAGKASTVA